MSILEVTEAYIRYQENDLRAYAQDLEQGADEHIRRAIALRAAAGKFMGWANDLKGWLDGYDHAADQ